MPSLFRIILLSLVVLSARAGDGPAIRPVPAWVLPVPADLSKKISADDISEGCYFPLMDQQVNLAAHAGYTHIIREVVNATGVQNAAEISVRFAPQFQHLVFHQVRILRAGRTIDQLKKERIRVVNEEEEADNFIYHGLKRAYITLLDVQPGDRIEYAWSLEGFNPVFGERYSGEFYFSGFTPYANYFVSLLAPVGRNLNVRTFNGAAQPEISSRGNYSVYRWSNPAIDLGNNRSDVPAWYTRSPYVAVTEFSGWKEVVDWGLGTFNQYRFSLPGDMEKKISGWRAETAGDPERFANLALRFVQDHIRYLGLEIGSNTHKPRDPASVCTSGFGDCKDKALLLATILRHENIEAYVALLNTTQRSMLKEAQPAPNQFDHAIVALKRDSGYFFLDPTISLQRGSLTDNFLPPYGYALVLKPGETGLEPVRQNMTSRAEITETADLSGGGKAGFTVLTKYLGGPADNARANFASNSLKTLGESFTGYYAKTYDGIEMISNPVITDDSTGNTMTITESYQIPHAWQKENRGRPAFSTYVKSIDDRLPAVPPDPGKAPLALRYPQTVSYTLKLIMPENFEAAFEPLHIKNDSYQFDFTQEAAGQTLVYKYYLRTFRDHIPAAEVMRFRKDYVSMSGVLSFRFTRGDGAPATPPAAGPPGWNWTNLWIALGFGVVFSALFRYCNLRSGFSGPMPGAAAIGGWTLVLGITLGVRLIVQSVLFSQEHYFQQEVRDALFRIGGYPVLVVYVLEMLQALWCIAGLGALLYWFCHRRNIFPLAFCVHLFVLMLFQFSIPAISFLAKTDSPVATRSEAWSALAQTGVYAAVWITYLRRSERVRQTFVQPVMADR